MLDYSVEDILLGLDIDMYHILSKEVTAVIHNAWKVAFNQTIAEFEDDCLRALSIAPNLPARFSKPDQLTPGTTNLLRFRHAGTPKVSSAVSKVASAQAQAAARTTT